jgi:hypothetical protein
MRGWWLWVGALLFSAGTLAGRADCPVRVGDDLAHVTLRMGHPARVIDTGDGQLLFFGSTLIYVKGAVVSFISVCGSSATGLELAPAAATPPAGSVVTLPPPPRDRDPWEVIVLKPREEELDAEHLKQRLASRTKRYAATKAYAMLSHSFHRAIPLLDGDSMVGLKDSRGHSMPAFGDTAWSDWYGAGIEVQNLVAAE